MKTVTILLALGGLAGTAHADQCEWVSEAQAAKAAAILANKPKLIEFCEPCGDAAPGEPFVPKAIERAAVGDGYQAVSIDGRSYDLAYTFAKTTDTHYENLAMLVGCPAEGVSPSLKIESETPSGVMIKADDHRPAAQVPAALDEPAPPETERVVPAAPPTSPQTIVYSTTYTQSISWLAVAIAGVGGFFAGGMTMLGAIALRRRRAMRPRASDLPLR
jgi:hypothetical protein